MSTEWEIAYKLSEPSEEKGYAAFWRTEPVVLQIGRPRPPQELFEQSLEFVKRCLDEA